MSQNETGGLSELRQKMIRDTQDGVGGMLRREVNVRAELEKLFGDQSHTTRRTRGMERDRRLGN